MKSCGDSSIYCSIKDQIRAEEQMAALKKVGGDSLEFKWMDFCDYYPTALRELTSLKHLSISACKTWQEHPAWIADLPLLESLVLNHGSGVGELLDNIHKLKHLRTLDIRGNNVKHLGDNFALLDNLEELRISGDHLTEFPKVLGRMPKLHTLEIDDSRCNMDDIFSVLASAPQLRKLKLKTRWRKDDKMPHEASVPDSIGKLSQLEELVLECGISSSVSDRMADMKALKRLTIRMPKLASLPSRLYEHDQLEYLDIESCSSLQLPDDLCALHNLKGLNLLSSPNEGLPRLTAQQMAQMEELHIQGPLPDLSPCKQLRTLEYCTRKPNNRFPDGCGKYFVWDKSDPETAFPQFAFPHLEKLQLHGGKYTDISFIINSPKLQAFTLWCDITCLPDDLGSLTQLETLELRHTISLHALPDSFADLVSLEHLCLEDVNYNHVPCDLSNLQKLKNVNLFYAKESVHTAGITGALYTIPNLEDLEIERVQDFMPDGISKLKKLRKLCLTLGETATHFPQDLGQLEELDTLEIAPYRTTYDAPPLPAPLPDLSGLKKLVSCTISGYRLPPSIFALPMLKFMVIAGQDFEELPESFCNLPNLAILRLDRCHHLKRTPRKLVQQGPLRGMEFCWCDLDDLPEGLETPGVLERVVWENNHKPFEGIWGRRPELDPIFFRFNAKPYGYVLM